MASSEALAIEPPRLRADVAGGLALSDAAGWNQSADDWAFFIAAGAALGIRDDGRRAGRDRRGAALRRRASAGSRWCSSTPSIAIAACASQLRRCLRRVAARRAAACRCSTRRRPAPRSIAQVGFVAGFAFERWKRDGAARPIARPPARRRSSASRAHGRRRWSRSTAATGGVDRALAARALRWRGRDTRAWLGRRRRRLRHAPRRPARDPDRPARRRATTAPRSPCSAPRSPASPGRSSSTCRRTARRSPHALDARAASCASARSSAWRSATPRAAAASAASFALAGPEFG